MNFRLCDTMGLEENQDLEAINFPYLLDGNIKDRFQVSSMSGNWYPDSANVVLYFNASILILQFNPSMPISYRSLTFNNTPTLMDKAHVVVFVVDGSNVCVLSQLMLDKLKAVKGLVKARG